jgi:hypothetical protein
MSMPLARCHPTAAASFAARGLADAEAVARRNPNDPASVAAENDVASPGSPSMAITPPIASDPHSADCGPRTTSIRETRSALSSSNRGALPAAGSLARMPSMTSSV